MRTNAVVLAVLGWAFAGCDCSDEKPSCRFTLPENGTLLLGTDDQSADPGFQMAVELATKRVAAGTEGTLSAQDADGGSIGLETPTPLVVASDGTAAGEISLDVTGDTEVTLSAQVGQRSCDVTFTISPQGDCGDVELSFDDPVSGRILN